MFLFLNISLLLKLYYLIINFINEWFVSEIDMKSFDSKTLIIKDLDGLKEKIWKVIIILLIVILFKQMILNLPKTQIEIIYFALAILMLALALKIVSIKSKK